MLPDGLSLNFCCDIQMAGSEFAINNMNLSPAAGVMCNGVGDTLFGTLCQLKFCSNVH